MHRNASNRCPTSSCFSAERRHERAVTWSEGTPGGQWRPYSYEVIAGRDKANMDITWLRDQTLDDSAMLPAPGVLAAEIVEDLRALLAQFQEIAEDLGVEVGGAESPSCEALCSGVPVGQRSSRTCYCAQRATYL